MNSILKKLESLGFVIKVQYSKGILAILDKGSLSTMIRINKNYKGYTVEFTEFIGNNIGRTKKFNTTSCKDICKFLDDIIK